MIFKPEFRFKASAPQIEILRPGDIVVADRGFVSYEFFSDIISKSADFIVRIKSKDFKKYHNLFDNSHQQDVVVEVPRPCHLSDESLILPALKIRLVKVVLPDGSIEVLATSLTNRRRYPASHFKTLYRMRWGIETYFHVLKSRLSIDNITGKSKENILQDYYSTIFVSGLETVITESANEVLAAKKLYASKR
jgi:IS4 transposase